LGNLCIELLRLVDILIEGDDSGLSVVLGIGLRGDEQAEGYGDGAVVEEIQQTQVIRTARLYVESIGIASVLDRVSLE
jgi:hypothetical protein